MDSGELKGETADALRTAVSTQPPKCYAAADAAAGALGALDAFADTVTWAQGQAQTAIDKWTAGSSRRRRASSTSCGASTRWTRTT
nr:hypothetical protein [Streptomyces sp. NBC_00525]